MWLCFNINSIIYIQPIYIYFFYINLNDTYLRDINTQHNNTQNIKKKNRERKGIQYHLRLLLSCTSNSVIVFHFGYAYEMLCKVMKMKIKGATYNGI